MPSEASITDISDSFILIFSIADLTDANVSSANLNATLHHNKSTYPIRRINSF